MYPNNYSPYQNMYYQNYQQAPQQNYSQSQSMPLQQSQVPQDEKLYVASKAAAEAYYVVPNGFVRLWDSNRNVFYEKRADANGRLFPMQSFVYYPEEEAKEEQKDYVTRTEFEDLSKQFSELNSKFCNYSQKRQNQQNQNQKEDKRT